MTQALVQYFLVLFLYRKTRKNPDLNMTWSLSIYIYSSVTTICYSSASHLKFSSSASLSQPHPILSSAEVLRMSSSGDKPMNTRDLRHVYVRRRRRNIIRGFEKVVRDLDLNAPPPAEPSMPKTDGSFEIKDDSPVSPASNLFEREAIIPRRKRSTTNRKPRHYPPPPSADHDESSSAVAPLSPAPILFQVSTIIPRRKRSTANQKPRRYPGRPVQPSLQLAPRKEWCCPACCRIDDAELLMPIKYLK